VYGGTIDTSAGATVNKAALKQTPGDFTNWSIIK